MSVFTTLGVIVLLTMIALTFCAVIALAVLIYGIGLLVKLLRRRIHGASKMN